MFSSVCCSHLFKATKLHLVVRHGLGNMSYTIGVSLVSLKWWSCSTRNEECVLLCFCVRMLWMSFKGPYRAFSLSLFSGYLEADSIAVPKDWKWSCLQFFSFNLSSFIGVAEGAGQANLGFRWAFGFGASSHSLVWSTDLSVQMDNLYQNMVTSCLLLSAISGVLPVLEHAGE